MTATPETGDQIRDQIREQATVLADDARRWMMKQAFPFWAERSVDPAGGFYERLDLDGHGIAGEDSRVRLQARMGFTFALAAEMGWDTARALDLTERSLTVLIRDCRRDDGLYGRIVRPGQGLVDDTPETYDNAFVLLAFATAARVFGLQTARDAGAALSRAIDEHLRRPDFAGGALDSAGSADRADGRSGDYAERLPMPHIREQNPQMHLTEASLAWFEATGDVAALERAQNLVAYTQARFVRSDPDMLVELDGVSNAENRVEAGHLFEWVWILGRMKQLGGRPPHGLMADLHQGGLRLLGGLEYLPLSQHLDGSVREATQRTWGPTEKLKGHIAMWRLNPSDDLARMIVVTASAMMTDHIHDALPGAWIDEIGPDRQSLIQDITPATGYHLFLALQEFMDFVDSL